MAKSRQSLAQGLSASIAQKFIADPENVQLPQTVALRQIQLPQKQPRRYFDSEKQTQLVRSIKEHGVLEPLLVRPVGKGKYELVAGGRRYRAAKEVGLKDVPAIIREFDDRQALQVALMENLQREDLNPIEETEGILELLAMEINGSVNEVTSVLHRANHARNRGQKLEETTLLKFQAIEAVMSGIGRLTVESFRTSRLPLLNLPAEILSALREGRIEFTKARAISLIKDKSQRIELLEKTIAEKLSLIEVRELTKASKPEVEATSERVLADRCSEISKRLRKIESWGDRKKRDRITKLLNELDKLTASPNAVKEP